jgi:hypothetical protein
MLIFVQEKKMLSIKETFEQWLTWRTGWDGGSAPTFTQDAVTKALEVIERLEKYFGAPRITLTDGIENPAIIPCTDAIIQLIYESKRGAQWELHIMIDDCGRLESCMKECYSRFSPTIEEIEEDIKGHSVKLPDPYCFMKY